MPHAREGTEPEDERSMARPFFPLDVDERGVLLGQNLQGNRRVAA